LKNEDFQAGMSAGSRGGNQAVKALGVIAAIAVTTFALPAFAGKDEINVAKGVIMANYTLEKCRSMQTPDDVIKGQVKVMRQQGISSNDIQQGFQEGMMEVEMKYPGSKKPPKSECGKAQYLYDQFLKFL